MPSGPETLKNYGQPEEDLSGLLDDDQSRERKKGQVLSQAELDEFVSTVAKELEQEKVLTPEVVKQNYERLKSFEKKLVFLNEADFETWLNKYKSALKERKGHREEEISKKIGVIKSIRKLIQAGDPRAALVEKENL